MKKKIAVLAGDGIGPEIMQEGLRVLNKIAEKFSHQFDFAEALIGGAAYDKHQEHFPAESLEIAKSSDVILFGSVGGPINLSETAKWKNCEANSILALRKAFSFSANYRPAKVYKELADICPLKAEIVSGGIDLLIIRELLGDLYFGEHSRQTIDGKRMAKDVAEYDEFQIRTVATAAFQAAEKRRKNLVSVDKANVLSTSKLWREVIHEVAADYPHVAFEDMLVDNCAMQIIKNPAQFDVIVTSNMFGDILSDAAAVLPGSLGLTPSASINAAGFGMYEPSGGSAPDIAGQGIANPIAQILSAAMMLKFSFGMLSESAAIEDAISKTLEAGYRTKDLVPEGKSYQSTSEFTDKILSFI